MASFLDIINTASAGVSLIRELAPKRKRNPIMKTVAGIPVRPTRNKHLGYVKVARNIWRFVDITDDKPAVVGPIYASKAELLADLDSYAKRAGWESDFAENPRGRSKRGVTRPSQKTGKAPSRRLIKRRKATRNAPAGFFANPVEIDALREQGTYGRVSETILLNKLAELSKLIKAPAYPAIGSLAFDMSYGGYQLVQIANEGLAESNLSPRFKAGEMAIFLDGAIMVARAVR